MQVHVGTSGFSFKTWRGEFYPAKLPESGFLKYYASHLNTVELNNTFYRMPTVNALRGWKAQVPPGFRFAVKAPQRLTHILRLKNCHEVLETFWELLQELGEQVGVVLFQLPPNFKLDVVRLQEFLQLLGQRTPVAFEFRHATWFDEPVFELLRQHQVGLVVGEPEKDEQVAPWLSTAPHSYVRLRKDVYTHEELATWAQRIKTLDVQEVFVFFKHEVQAPAYAAQLVQLLRSNEG